MAEYIEREALLKAIDEKFNAHYGNTAYQFIHDFHRCVQRQIRKALAADVVEVKHGKWKYFHKQNIAVCTNCSFERDLDANFGCAVSCPNCGARMDGE